MAVGMFEYQKAKSPHILETAGIGPCLGIAIYDPKTRSGYIGHFPAPLANKAFEEMISVVKKDYKELSALEVTLAGMSLDCVDDDLRKDVSRSRKILPKYLRGHGFKNIKKEYCDTIFGASLMLDLKTGKTIIENDLNEPWNSSR